MYVHSSSKVKQFFATICIDVQASGNYSLKPKASALHGSRPIHLSLLPFNMQLVLPVLELYHVEDTGVTCPSYVCTEYQFCQYCVLLLLVDLDLLHVSSSSSSSSSFQTGNRARFRLFITDKAA